MLFLRPFCRYCLFLGSLYPFQRAIRAVFRLFFRFFRLSPCFGRLFPSIFLRLARFPASVRFPVHKNIICKDTVRGGTFCPFSFPRSLTLAAQSPQATRGGADHAAPRRSLIPSSRRPPVCRSVFALPVCARTGPPPFTPPPVYRPLSPSLSPLFYPHYLLCTRSPARVYIPSKTRTCRLPVMFSLTKKENKKTPARRKAPHRGTKAR